MLLPMSTDEEREKRRAARANWPIVKSTLAEQGRDDDISAHTTMEQRLEMMFTISARGWALTGREWPAYSRAEMPTRLIRPEET